MDERSHDVQVRVAVGDHHAFRARRRSTCVVDGQEIGFGDIDFVVISVCVVNVNSYSIQPLFRDLQRNEVFDARQPVSNAIPRLRCSRSEHKRSLHHSG